MAAKDDGHTEASNASRLLREGGQSVWLDNINRDMLRSGALARYVHELGVTGLTSNPTILGRAMAGSADYDASLRAHLDEGLTDPQELVYAVALEDLAEAAALLRPTWDATGGDDGYVSVEVPPDLAYDAVGTAAFARRLRAMATFPNLLVKIPGTPQGLTAVERVLDAGIGVNVTLLFSDAQYVQTAEAYMRALDRRRSRGATLAVPSVASVFVSRWDTAADPALPAHLHGTLGLAVAAKVYASFRALLSSPQWRELAALGARPQRVLWASTSTKDPLLPSGYYVNRLLAPGTIDTMPEKTLLALGQGDALGPGLKADFGAAERAVAAIAKNGVGVRALGELLQRQGALRFSADWDALVKAVAGKVEAANLAVGY
jgi:transaldolase